MVMCVRAVGVVCVCARVCVCADLRASLATGVYYTWHTVHGACVCVCCCVCCLILATIGEDSTLLRHGGVD